NPLLVDLTFSLVKYFTCKIILSNHRISKQVQEQKTCNAVTSCLYPERPTAVFLDMFLCSIYSPVYFGFCYPLTLFSL
ncbi:hypothetical protein L9F63_006297, partial [Diploptera punctata]